jgi:ComF family protein
MLMARPAFEDGPDGYPDVVTCIPTTRRRKFWRGFNLSEELARAVADDLNLPLHPLLKKTKHHEQRGRSARQRASSQTDISIETNLDLTGKHILIVDDVMTTGSTLHAAAALLKESNANKVGAWCFARTPKTR